METQTELATIEGDETGTLILAYEPEYGRVVALYPDGTMEERCGDADSIADAIESIQMWYGQRNWRLQWLPAAAKALAAASGVDDGTGNLYTVCEQALLDGEGTPERVREIWADATAEATADTK